MQVSPTSFSAVAPCLSCHTLDTLPEPCCISHSTCLAVFASYLPPQLSTLTHLYLPRNSHPKCSISSTIHIPLHTLSHLAIATQVYPATHAPSDILPKTHCTCVVPPLPFLHLHTASSTQHQPHKTAILMTRHRSDTL